MIVRELPTVTIETLNAAVNFYKEFCTAKSVMQHYNKMNIH